MSFLILCYRPFAFSLYVYVDVIRDFIVGLILLRPFFELTLQSKYIAIVVSKWDDHLVMLLLITANWQF